MGTPSLSLPYRPHYRRGRALHPNRPPKPSQIDPAKRVSVEIDWNTEELRIVPETDEETGSCRYSPKI